MKKHFYITTTLPYINSEPHVGFAMELIRADIIARSKSLQGFEVFFNTGTDEHGAKIYENAIKEGIKPLEYADRASQNFRDLAPLLNIATSVPGITYNFIRTTDEAHTKAAQMFWNTCLEKGDIYKKNYRIKYCVGCELEKTESELVDEKCPLHTNRDIEVREEENYFFKFSKYADYLLELYNSNTTFVLPETRLNEIKKFVERGLEDFSISRLTSKMPWGVPVPNDKEQAMYVWFDALVNYVSAVGWPSDMEKFNTWWLETGGVVQYAGKDNLRQQSAMWQAMLASANLPASKQIIIEGFINAEGGVKMSKSLGNFITPEEVVREYGADALRYFVAREVSCFEDGVFTMGRFKDSYNGNLANGIGNLVSRIMKMAQDNLSSPVLIADLEDTRQNDSVGLVPKYFDFLNTFEINKAADLIWAEIGSMDLYIQTNQPFKLVKIDKENGQQMISELVVRLYSVARMLNPIMPATSAKIKELIKSNKSPESPLFIRKD